MTDDARDDKHEDGHDERDHVEQLDLLEGDARDAGRYDVQCAEQDRAEDGERGTPHCKDDERDGEPADALDGLIDRRADNAAHVVHDVA